MGSIPQETSEFDDVRPEDSASQVGGQFLGTMSTVGTTKKSPPPPPPPPMGGSPRIARSRPGVPPQTTATSAPMQTPPAPRLPAKFSQEPPPGEIASSSRPDVMRPKTPPKTAPKTPPKRPPAKTPPVKGVPKKAKATEPAEIKGSVGRVQPRTPSPKRALWPAEERARNDAAARGSAPAKAEAAKAPPVTVDIVTPNAAVDIVTPVSDNARQADAHLAVAPGFGRLSALTTYQATPASSQAPTPTSPAGDSLVAGETSAPVPAAPSSMHWSQAPISPLPPTPPVAPVGGETEVCVACQGSGLLNSQVNLRLFRLIGTGQLRLAGQAGQVAPVTPAPAAPATLAPAAPAAPAPAAANPNGPGNGTEVNPSLSENSGRSRTPTCSGVCTVTEDGSMTMFDSGGNLLILELACGVDSVIQNASREFGCGYIGIHAGLELLSTQRQAYKFFKSFAEGFSGSADLQKLIQVHISLPYIGGSPLLDLSKKNRKPAQDAYFRLLDHCKRYVLYVKGMSNVCSAVTLELPKSNRFWSDEKLKKFLTDHNMQKFADCVACTMGLETSQGQPIGKVFRIACSDQVLATGLEKRF